MADSSHVAALFASTDRFVDRHIAPSAAEIAAMLEVTGFDGLEALTAATVPEAIRRDAPLALPEARSEAQMLARARELASHNRPVRSYLGMGYVRTITPPVIARNILENPAWYTQYTPYQPEIAQGRLEAILNFQTVVTDLTGMDIANASLLDEGTAAAEAMTMCAGIVRGPRQRFWVASSCHPQTIAVLQTRAQPMGIEVVVAELADFSFDAQTIGALVQYPDTAGEVHHHGALCERAHEAGALVVVATDLLALTLLTPPGAWGADVVVGSAQRFGVPMGFGGPHAAFFATRDAHKRKIPGRLVGVTRDARGEQALRLALQTREQHIRRDKATSNICTSQVLLAVMASMYAVYHGPEGLRRIAARIMGATQALGHALKQLGFTVSEAPCFDTLWVQVSATERDTILARAKAADVELRQLDARRLALTLDEAVTQDEVEALLRIFGGAGAASVSLEQAAASATGAFEGALARTSDYLTHPTFHQHHAEHEMLRYMYRLQQRDLSLTTSMIPLGSCTMKLNATAEMMPISLEGFANLHPFTDPANARGYGQLIKELEAWLGEITGMAAVSLQPNAGSQGEYAGLLAIRAYHEARGEAHRDVCLIPSSAHGTNPASAAMAGMQVVVVRCDERGNVDLEDLEAKAQANADKLAAVMVTYPSTHGVFEAGILQLTEIVHRHGAQVYMDGANMNAQVGLCRPGDFGVDVCHLNLHKTFCIPHGGGGPGVGPIAAREHLAPHLPNHPVTPVAGVEGGAGAVSAAPYGSASILPISWMYIGMMGAQGLRRATQVAILNANYLAKRLGDAYPLLYTGAQGTVAHEFILDLRPLREATGVTVVDVAKRLMDYGFHAPTMSWPVEGTLMIEPTESESKAELDRFAQAMLSIREEIEAIARGEVDLAASVLRNAPHTAAALTAAEWDRPYSREQAAHPVGWTRQHKFWPAVSRVDDTYGDRNLMCSCPPLTDYDA